MRRSIAATGVRSLGEQYFRASRVGGCRNVKCTIANCPSASVAFECAFRQICLPRPKLQADSSICSNCFIFTMYHSYANLVATAAARTGPVRLILYPITLVCTHQPQCLQVTARSSRCFRAPWSLRQQHVRMRLVALSRSTEILRNARTVHDLFQTRLASQKTNRDREQGRPAPIAVRVAGTKDSCS